MNKILILFILQNLTIAHAGLFGPSNYEECVLEGLKNTNTNASVQLLNKVCSEKFHRDGQKKILTQCSVTWDGNTFIAGKPDNVNSYTQVTFKGTTDILFLPTSSMDKFTRTFILKESKKILAICPSITFE